MSTENTMPTWARSPFERDAVALVSELRVEHPISRMFALTSAFLVRAREEGVATARAYVDLLAEALDWTDEQIDARLAAVVEPLIDRFFGPRPAVVGGECAVCLHAIPQHEPTCIVVQWRSPAPTVEKARANFLRAVDADANPPATPRPEDVAAWGLAFERTGARGAIVAQLRRVAAKVRAERVGTAAEACALEYERAAGLVEDVSEGAAFLLRLAVLSAEDNPDDGLDLLYSTIDDLLRAGRFVEVDALLASASERLYSPAILLGFLSTTWPAQDKLAFRAAFGQRVGAHLAETMKPAKVEALLRGLLDVTASAIAPTRCPFHASGGHPDDRHGRDPARVIYAGAGDTLAEGVLERVAAALEHKIDRLVTEAAENRPRRVMAGRAPEQSGESEKLAGQEAARGGAGPTDNPHLAGSPEHTAWALGRVEVMEGVLAARVLATVERQRDEALDRIAALEAELTSSAAQARSDTLDAIIDQTQRELSRRGR